MLSGSKVASLDDLSFELAQGGPQLWPLLHLAMVLQALGLLTLVEVPWSAEAGWSFYWLFWAGLYLALGAGTWVYRVAITELLIGLSSRERVWGSMFILAAFFGPAAIVSRNVIPDGVLWPATLLLALAVRPGAARWALAWSLFGAWVALGRIDGVDRVALARLAMFAFSWLLALGAVHFVFIGEAYRLRGWWAWRRVVINTFWAGLSGVGVAAIFLWLGPLHRVVTEPKATTRGPMRSAPSARVNFLDVADLAYHLMLLIVLVTALLASLYYFHRWLVKRRRKPVPVQLMPGQQSQLHFEPTLKEERDEKLEGMRAEIVECWGRWARRQAREGYGREAGETVAEYHERLRESAPDLAPPPEIRELFEAAHYGPVEPDRAALDRMRRWEKEMSREFRMEN